MKPASIESRKARKKREAVQGVVFFALLQIACVVGFASLCWIPNLPRWAFYLFAALAVACAVGIWQGSGSQEALTAVISVDGTEVNSTEEVRAALNEHSTGEQMNMEIERDGNTIEVMVSL